MGLRGCNKRVLMWFGFWLAVIGFKGLIGVGVYRVRGLGLTIWVRFNVLVFNRVWVLV